MVQYIVAFNEENYQSEVSVYDVEDSLGDIFTVENNPNIDDYFRESFREKADDEPMNVGQLVLVTEQDLTNLVDKYPADKTIADMAAAVLNAMDIYPDTVFYYTYE
jgi:hypothetical protein